LRSFEIAKKYCKNKLAVDIFLYYVNATGKREFEKNLINRQTDKITKSFSDQTEG
jgi:hypothetical protein